MQMEQLQIYSGFNYDGDEKDALCVLRLASSQFTSSEKRIKDPSSVLFDQRDRKFLFTID